MYHGQFTRRGMLAATSAAIAGTAGTRIAWSQEGNRLIARTDGDAQILDPAFEIGGSEEIINDAILVTLTEFERDGSASWKPYAAKSIEAIDDRTIEFELLPGLRWSGGYGEVSAEDVKFSFERIADPATESTWQDEWVLLDRVDVIDNLRGRIVFKEPFAAVWAVLPRYTGHILCKAAMEASGSTTFTTDPPAYCGPYMIGEWVQGQKIVLVRNPDWSGPAPDFDTVELVIVEDDKAAELGFDAGDLDYTKISITSLPQYRERAADGSISIFETPGLNYLWLGMNVDHPKLQDIRVRQAIQYTIDVDQIIEGAYGGLAQRAHGINPPSIIGSRSASLIQAPDLEKASALLADAGAEDLELTLTVMNVSERLAMGQILQAQLAQVGITVEVLPYDSAVFWNLGLESQGDDWKELQLYIGRYTSGADPYINTQWFTCDQVGEWNWERMCSEEFTELHNRAIGEADPQARHDMYVRMQDIMEESGAYVFISHELNAAVHRPSIQPAVRPDFEIVARNMKTI